MATQRPLGIGAAGGEVIKLWHKNLLYLTVEKAYCVLYQPVMQDKKLWSELRSR